VVFRREPRVQIKTPEQIEKMRAAGLVVADALAAVRAAVAPGVTTRQLDAIAESTIRGAGAIPSFIGVPSYTGPDFPASICASVNDEVVHGIPGDRVLREGDVISIDCGAILDGWHGDAAVTVPVGAVDPEVATLLEVCEESLWRGMAAARLGGHVTDISHAIETYVRSRGDFGVLEDYVGHGIGSSMHMPPNVPNFGRPGRGPRLVRGLALAVEPMITSGTIDTAVLDDHWTVVTADGSLAAHFEHTFTLTEAGVWVLTALDGGHARLAELGVAYGGPTQ
jgi:methionyl aminopeptidase